MLSLSDNQLEIVVSAARAVAPERRDIFSERIAAMLKLRRRFDDRDVNEVTALALRGLIQTADTAA